MSIEKTVSEIAEILGVSRQAVNNRVKQLPEEDLEKNAKGVTVVKRSGLIKLEEIYKKTIFDDEPIDDQLRVKDVQIAEKDKQIDQQQQLTLTAMKDKEELKLELDEAKVEVDEAKAQVEEIQTKQEEASKKGFFGRLFGK